MRDHRRGVLAACSLVVTAVAGPSTVAAHQSEAVGDLTVTFGWQAEPAYSGLPNAVHVKVTDAAGEAIDVRGARLTVVVSFGDASVVRPLDPLREPGELAAAVIPVQAGTYGFQFMGTVAGETVDIASTCSDTTYDCVLDATEIQFPAPAAAEPTPTSGGSPGGDSDRNVLAIVALVVSAIALVGTTALALRIRRTESSR